MTLDVPIIGCLWDLSVIIIFSVLFVAWETLCVPEKRRSYDSVDPEFDDSTPDKADAKEHGFFETFSEAFDSNAR